MVLGRTSTALEAVQGYDLSKQVAVVTGGNSGIGAETVRALATAGARVILTARDAAAGQAVAHRLSEQPGRLKGGMEVRQLDLADPGSVQRGSIEVRQLDLADLVSVQQLGASLAEEKRIDLLILNAGVMMCPRSFSKDGFELQWATNHLGHAALTQALLPKLQAQDTPSRIVVLASSAHQFQRKRIAWDDLDFSRRKYTPRAAYGQSKLANILFAKGLAAQLKGTKVTPLAVHPGVVETPLWRHIWARSGCFAGLFALARRSSLFGIKTPAQGAATTIYAATAPELQSRPGAYLADCREVTPSKQAQDAKQAAKLLEVTEAQLAHARMARASLNAELAKSGGGRKGGQQQLPAAG